MSNTKQRLRCTDGTFELQMSFLVICVWLPVEEESVVSGKSTKLQPLPLHLCPAHLGEGLR